MNGIIHVDSTPGKGTRFEVTLEFPIDKDADAEVPQLSLLLFRCTPKTYARIQDAVEGKPILLQSAPQLEDAITLLRKSSFDVILMPCKTPSEDIQKSKEAGMDEHLSEPVDISALEQAVRRFHVTPPPEINSGRARYAR